MGKDAPRLWFLPMAGTQGAGTVCAELVRLVLTTRGEAAVVDAIDANTGLALPKEASAARMREGRVNCPGVVGKG